MYCTSTVCFRASYQWRRVTEISSRHVLRRHILRGMFFANLLFANVLRVNWCVSCLESNNHVEHLIESVKCSTCSKKIQV